MVAELHREVPQSLAAQAECPGDRHQLVVPGLGQETVEERGPAAVKVDPRVDLVDHLEYGG